MKEANLMLERRMMSEKRILLEEDNEEDKKDGDIDASPRPKNILMVKKEL